MDEVELKHLLVYEFFLGEKSPKLTNAVLIFEALPHEDGIIRSLAEEICEERGIQVVQS